MDAGFVDNLTNVRGILKVNGWAINPQSKKKADMILIIDKETKQIISYNWVGQERSDVAKQYNNNNYINSGWSLEFNTTLAKSNSILQAYSYSMSDKIVYLLNKEFNVN